MRQRPRVVVIIGETGGGKTSVSRAIVGSDKRVVVAAPYMKNAYGADPFATYEAAAAAMYLQRPREFRISIACYSEREFARVCNLAWAYAPVTLVVDETATVMPNTAAAPREFRFVCQIGRHAGADEEQEISVVVIGQRPPNIPTWCASEAREVYVFPLSKEGDALKVCEDFSVPKDQRDAVVTAIQTLPKYHRLRMTKLDSGQWVIQKGTGT